MSETLDQLKANAGLITNAVGEIQERDTEIEYLKAEAEEHIQARSDLREEVQRLQGEAGDLQRWIGRLRARLERIETMAAEKAADSSEL